MVASVLAAGPKETAGHQPQQAGLAGQWTDRVWAWARGGSQGLLGRQPGGVAPNLSPAFAADRKVPLHRGVVHLARPPPGRCGLQTGSPHLLQGCNFTCTSTVYSSQWLQMSEGRAIEFILLG